MIKAIWLSLIMFASGPLEDPRQEARAQALMREIRCVACENEPISQSGAEIASDMRDRVRDLIADGASDDEVRAWFAERYGERALFRPGADGPGGLLLWAGPFALFLLAGAGIAWSRRTSAGKGKAEAVAPEAFDHEDANKV